MREGTKVPATPERPSGYVERMEIRGYRSDRPKDVVDAIERMRTGDPRPATPHETWRRFEAAVLLARRGLLMRSEGGKRRPA